jgi:phosphoglycolate phosphatase-like HAD superfamily hydrolase
MFDYDGVIVDSQDVFATTFMAACHACGYTGIKSHEQVIRLFDGNFFEELAQLGLSSDKIEGKKAGAVTVAVTWGWHSKEKLADASPDHMVHTPAELVTLLS